MLQWYKGRIVNIIQGSKIDVKYVDGEIDEELDSKNVKSFKPYTAGEIIEVSLEDDFIEVEVIRIVRNELVVKSKYKRQTFTVDERNARRFY